MSLKHTQSQYCLSFQRGLTLWLAEELGLFSERHKRFVRALESVRVEEFLREH